MKKIKQRFGMKGRYRLVVRKADTMEITKDTGWFDNLIVNTGLDRIGTTGSFMSWNCVGTDNSAVLPSNSTLGNQIARTDTIQSQGNSTVSDSPYGIRLTRQFRYGTGAAAGNLTEVGVGWTNASPMTLFSRALILDSEGAPTTLTVLSDEILDVFYELRIYPTSLDDVVGSLSGYTYTLRPAQVTNWHAQTLGFTLSTILEFFILTNGTIGDVFSSPSGTQASLNIANATNLPYVPGSFEANGRLVVPLNTANFGSGISAFSYAYGCSRWQIGFSPSIMKTSSQTLTLEFSVTWGNDV